MTAIAALLVSLPALPDVTIINGSILFLNQAASVSAGPITFDGNGTMWFTGSFALPNDIVFNAGVIGTINTNGQSNTLTGLLSGGGSLLNTGPGVLSLTGANTFSGGTRLSAGTLAIGSNTALGTGTLTLDGGTLLGTADVTPGNAIDFNGNVAIAAASGTTLSIGTGFWTLPAGSAVTIGAPGATGTVFWNAVGGQSVAFGTPLKIAAGTLKVGTNGQLLVSFADSLVIDAGGTLDLAGNSATSSLGTLSGGGRITTSSGAPTLNTRGGSFSGVVDGALALNQTFGTLILTAGNSYTGGTTIAAGTGLQLGDGGAGGSISGNVLNNGALAVNRSGHLALAGVISGSGTLAKQGAGMLTLTGENTFSGGTTLSAGTLGVGRNTALGTGKLVFDGGTLLGTADIVLANPIDFNGSVGVAAATGTTMSISGPWTLNGLNGVALTIGSPGATGTVLWNTAPGSMGLNAPLKIDAGTLKLGDNGEFLLNFAGSLAIESGGTLDLAGKSAMTSVGALSGAGRITTSSGAATLSTHDGSFAGVIDGALALSQKFGPISPNTGTLTLTGANTYSGGTTIAAGTTLRLGNGGAGGSIIGDVVNHGTLVVNQTSDSALSGVISGSGKLAKHGVGWLTVTGANSFTGGTTNAAGSRLQLGNGTLGGSLGNIVNSGTLLLNGGLLKVGTVSMGDAGSAVTLRAGALTLDGSGIFTDKFVIADVAGSVASLTLSTGKTLATDLEIVGQSGSGSFTQSGGTHTANTLLLGENAGSNGIFTLAGGTFTVATIAAGAGIGTFNFQGGALHYSGVLAATNFNLGGGVSYSGALNIANAMKNFGRVTTSGQVTIGGRLDNSGSLEFAGGSTVVNGDVANLAGATLQISDNPARFAGDVVNNGTIRTISTTTTFTGSFTNNGRFISDPSTQVFQDIAVGAQGVLQGGAGDVFVVNGDMSNHSEARTEFDIGAATLMFSSGPHDLVWSATNLGATVAGYHQNFAVGIFELSMGGSLDLSGTSTVPGANALYVHRLLLGDGLGQIASIRSGGLDIYYDPAESANAYLHGATYSLAGGGRLMAVAAVPEPETYALWLAGLGLMSVVIRRRRKARAG